MDNFSYSEKLLNELMVNEDSLSKEMVNLLFSCETPSQFVEMIDSQAPYEYFEIIKNLSTELLILDVGVGMGASSVYLAINGFNVFAVEPTKKYCDLLQFIASKFSLPISVFEGVAETVSRLNLKFDVVLFNSSLHHCDNPELALHEAFNVLNDGGRIYLINENFLKPWISESRYQSYLLSNPIGMGHYGGNEHSYSNVKYLKMLKSVFGRSNLLLPRQRSALNELEVKLNYKINGQRVVSSNHKMLLRFLFYIFKEKLHKYKLIYYFLGYLSLVPVHFFAIKLNSPQTKKINTIN